MFFVKQYPTTPVLIISILTLFSSLAACSGGGGVPKIVNHPAPDWTVQPVDLELTGCGVDDSGREVCPPNSPAGQLGCQTVTPAGNYLGALEPAAPLSVCWVPGASGVFLDSSEYIYRDGCLLPLYARYLTENDGSLALIADLPGLKKNFAPITSPDEALSYAIAATGLAAYFGFEPPEGFRYSVSQMEDSHVETTTEGAYKVYLYDYLLCGCGPHTTSYVELTVMADGSFEETGRIPVFEDPEQDGLCVD